MGLERIIWKIWAPVGMIKKKRRGPVRTPSPAYKTANTFFG